MIRKLPNPNSQRALDSLVTACSCVFLLALMAVSYQATVAFLMFPRSDHWLSMASMTVLGLVCFFVAWLLAHSPVRWVKFD